MANNPSNIPNLVNSGFSNQNLPITNVAMPAAVPNFPNQDIPLNTITIFGQAFQKKYVYILGFILLIVVIYLIWKWYSKGKKSDDDDDESNDEEFQNEKQMRHMGMNFPPNMPVYQSNKNKNYPENDQHPQHSLNEQQFNDNVEQNPS